MPHIKLEYTNNIVDEVNFPKLFLELHQVLADIAKAKIDTCKSRVFRLDTFFIGEEQKNQAFLHTQVFLLEGRSLEIKREISKKFLEILKKFYSKSIKNLDLQITVDIKDMTKATYYKFPEETFTVL